MYDMWFIPMVFFSVAPNPPEGSSRLHRRTLLRPARAGARRCRACGRHLGDAGAQVGRGAKI